NININFNNPVPFNQIGTPPYNPFIFIEGNREVEVHLPNSPPTSLVNRELLGTGDDSSNPNQNRYYVSDQYLPWAINLPVSFDYPIEKRDITETHLMFNPWALSNGFNYMDWYQDLPGYRNINNIYRK
ncbi:MAG: DUF4842 domain-containing protein, partial [Bacteroidales bacterium]|nr:DUF4842 domain-containing protein [Bacteroidales bacterium]